MASLRYVPVIGLVGGVGSGKSSVANHLGLRQSIVVIDGDAAGHAVLKLAQIKQQLQQVFGTSIFDDEGNVDRSALGRLVFGDSPTHQASRQQLESLVHPQIKELLSEQVEQARQSSNVDVIFLDAAVLFEAGWNDLCDSVVFIDTPLAIRQQRVAESRGWDKEMLHRRESSQWPLAQKQQQADFTIDNSRSLDDATRQLAEILNQIRNNTK